MGPGYDICWDDADDTDDYADELIVLATRRKRRR